MERISRSAASIRTLFLRSLLSVLIGLGRRVQALKERNIAYRQQQEREGKLRPDRSKYVELEESESSELDALTDWKLSGPPHREVTRPTYQLVYVLRAMSVILVLLAMVAFITGSESFPTEALILLCIVLLGGYSQLSTQAMLPAIHKYGITRVALAPPRFKNCLPRLVVLVCPPLSGPVLRRSRKERKNGLLLDLFTCINTYLAADSLKHAGKSSAMMINFGIWCCVFIVVCHVLSAVIPNSTSKILINLPQPQPNARDTKTYRNIRGLRISSLSLFFIRMVIVIRSESPSYALNPFKWRYIIIWASFYSLALLWVWIRNQYDRSLEYRRETVLNLRTFKAESHVVTGEMKAGQHNPVLGRINSLIYDLALNGIVLKLIVSITFEISLELVGEFCGVLAAVVGITAGLLDFMRKDRVKWSESSDTTKEVISQMDWAEEGHGESSEIKETPLDAEKAGVDTVA